MKISEDRLPILTFNKNMHACKVTGIHRGGQATTTWYLVDDILKRTFDSAHFSRLGQVTRYKHTIFSPNT